MKILFLCDRFLLFISYSLAPTLLGLGCIEAVAVPCNKFGGLSQISKMEIRVQVGRKGHNCGSKLTWMGPVNLARVQFHTCKVAVRIGRQAYMRSKVFDIGI